MQVRMNLLESANPRVEAAVRKVLDENLGNEEPFFILDFEKIVQVFRIWKKWLPRVKPFYAVKVNPHPLIMGMLAALGTGFDCASKMEIEQVLSNGGASNDIIFANPVKFPSHVTFAKKSGVERMTFDTMDELRKISSLYPSAKLVLRIKSPKTGSSFSLSDKFGAALTNVPELLAEVGGLGLNLIGVSFHVGTNAFSGDPYVTSIEHARQVFDMANELGLQLHLLDIGGGFTSVRQSGALFLRIAQDINTALDKYFPPESNVEVIAEPGTYFAEGAMTLVTNVLLSKCVGSVQEVFLSDGIYGSLRSTTYGEVDYNMAPYLHGSGGSEKRRSLVDTKFWGPTCDSMDVLNSGDLVPFPQMWTGDWVVVPNWGAYTSSQASIGFNGMPNAEVKGYLVSEEALQILQNMKTHQAHTWSDLSLISHEVV